MPPRIITLTLNPALDLAAQADEVVRRQDLHDDEHAHPGGGGVNVARVLQELEGDVSRLSRPRRHRRVFEETLD